MIAIKNEQETQLYKITTNCKKIEAEVAELRVLENPDSKDQANRSEVGVHKAKLTALDRVLEKYGEFHFELAGIECYLEKNMLSD